jgi:hypothetical protein
MGRLLAEEKGLSACAKKEGVMEWASVVSVISSAAPILGSLFGPAGTAVGALAGTGIKLAARALGVEPTQSAVAEAIATDPQAALKLAQYEMDNKLELQKLEVKMFELELADRASARNRQVEHEKATGKSDTNLYVLAWVIVLGFFVLIGVLLFVPLPSDSSGVVFMLFGALSAGFGAVIQYFFGSSKSSESKTDMIYHSTPNLPKKPV